MSPSASDMLPLTDNMIPINAASTSSRINEIISEPQREGHLPLPVSEYLHEHLPISEHLTVGEHLPADEHLPVSEHLPVVEHFPVGEHFPASEHLPAVTCQFRCHI